MARKRLAVVLGFRHSFRFPQPPVSSSMHRFPVCLLLASFGLASGALAQSATPPTAAILFNIRDFGATGDGKTLDTAAINKAIDAAAAAGGGMVVFPAGTYASYSIHLKSNVSLY